MLFLVYMHSFPQTIPNWGCKNELLSLFGSTIMLLESRTTSTCCSIPAQTSAVSNSEGYKIYVDPSECFSS